MLRHMKFTKQLFFAKLYGTFIWGENESPRIIASKDHLVNIQDDVKFSVVKLVALNVSN